MWIPKSEEDIEVATSNRSLSETVTFDAKREIPTKNVATAIDVSALANSSGGVLLYGVDEDSSGCPCVLNPIPLANQRERIEQIVRTSIDEVPVFKIFPEISTRADSAKGYLVVLVPPSERAPHMVIVKGERRYYGRGETGNYILSHAEVARLYERRQRLLDSDVVAILTQYLSAPPLPEKWNRAHLHVVVKPVLSDDSLLKRALKEGQTPSVFLSNLVAEVRDDETIFASGMYSPDFNTPTGGWKRYPEGYLGKLSYADPSDPVPDIYTLQVTVNLDGSGYLFCGRASDVLDDKKCFFPSIVMGNTSRFLAMLGRLFERGSYFGMVDIGLAVTQLQGCVNYESRVVRMRPLQYDGPDYKKTSHTSALTLLENPKLVASHLLSPLFESMP
jgi:hypothetical protein